jgi:hypothetical protein
MYLSQVTDKLYHIYISTLNGRNSTNLSKFINNHIFEICKAKTNIYNVNKHLEKIFYTSVNIINIET